MAFLPNLIFTENHEDSKTCRVLNKLVLRLGQLGYQSFLDEMPKGTTVKSYTQIIDENEGLYKQTARKLQREKGIDIDNPQSLAHAFFSTMQGMRLAHFIKQHQANRHYKPLLKSLEANGMDYVAVDNHGSDIERERSMSQEFLHEKSPFFSRIGRSHARNIQETLLTQCADQFAADRFCFFDIFSDASARTRVKNSDLPLGVVSINAAHLSDDEVVEQIVRHIAEKQRNVAKQKASQVQPSYRTYLNMLASTVTGICYSMMEATSAKCSSLTRYFSS